MIRIIGAPSSSCLIMCVNVCLNQQVYLRCVPYVDKTLIKYGEQNLLGEGIFGNVYGGSFQGTPAAVKRKVFGPAELEDKDIQHEIHTSL